MFFKTFLITALVALKATEALCPSGYTEFNEKCYKIFASEYLSKPAAAARCLQDANGTLASIPNAFVNNFLSVLANNVSDTQFYIGLNCSQVNSVGDYSGCTWDDGTPFVYQNFMPNSPYPGSACAYMDTLNKSSGFWQSYNCVTALRFACQTNAVVVETTKRPTTTVAPIPGGCNQGTLYAPGDISSPNWPDNYPLGVSCKYSLSAQNPLQRLQITFTNIDVEQFDPIFIYDGPTVDYPMLGALRGHYQSQKSYNSTNYQMLVTFSSNRERNGHGFTATFVQIDN